MTIPPAATLEAICAGAAAPLCGDPAGRSGIHKHALAGPVRIGPRGVEGDRQVNRRYHGFPAMALHHYPRDHYPWLGERFDHPAPLAAAGGMGENLSTHGLREDDVCIGARFRLGTALIEVTQPRQPCATIEKHLQRKGVVKAIVESGRCGWFYRVLEPGMAEAGCLLDPVEEGHAEWSVRRAFMAVYGGKAGSADELRDLDSLARVSDRLRGDIARRLGVR